MKIWASFIFTTVFLFISSWIYGQNKIGEGLYKLRHDTSTARKKRLYHKLHTKRPLTGPNGLYPWEGAFGIKPGIIYNGSIFGEFGIIKTDIPPYCDLYAMEDISLASEYNFNLKHFIIGPKFSFEYCLTPLDLKASFIYYSDFKDRDLRILPEIGFGFAGIINLYYGYAIPLQKFEFGSIGRSRISLNFNIPLFY
jgi:hypothetical protein